MQGSYKDRGLPRPYYMKPTKRNSIYDKMPRSVFLTNSRKLTGYLILLFFFGLCVFLVSQELKTPPDLSYSIVKPDSKDMSDKKAGNVLQYVDTVNERDTEINKVNLAKNVAQNSKGELGHAVMQAPKGGKVNEAKIMENDEDEKVNGKIKKSEKGQ